MEPSLTNSNTASTTPSFQIQRLYVAEQSFKLPHSPIIFKEEWKPDIQLEVNIKHEALDADAYEVLLHLTVNAKLNNRTAFNLEVKQAGLFELKGYTPEQLHYLLKAYCPSLLFPYARKVIADKTLDASLPPLTLAPINFEALYQDQQKAATQPSKTASQTEAVLTEVH